MEKKAIYAVVLAALIAGSNGILIKAMPSLTTGAIGWFRAGVPVLFLLPVLLRTNQLRVKGNTKMLLFASVINAVRTYFFLMAFVYLGMRKLFLLLFLLPTIAFGQTTAIPIY